MHGLTNNIIPKCPNCEHSHTTLLPSLTTSVQSEDDHAPNFPINIIVTKCSEVMNSLSQYYLLPSPAGFHLAHCF